VLGSASADLAKTYGVNSGRFHVLPFPATDYLALNSARPAFSSAKVRRAVSYAVDRTQVAGARNAVSGAYAADPWSHLLQPGVPAASAKPYPLTPNLAQARSLMGGQTLSPVFIVQSLGASSAIAQAVANNLEPIGIHAQIQILSGGDYFRRLSDPSSYDMAIESFAPLYIDPQASFLGTFSSFSYPPFKDSSFDKAVGRAEALNPQARTNRYGKLVLTEAKQQAPIVTLDARNSRFFVSSNVTPVVGSPIYGGLDLAAVGVR
jgi:ABC-type transport system substrate-binding protein